MIRPALGLLLALLAGAPGPPAERLTEQPAERPTERIVSLNLCTDQMLVLLAPEKVVGLTPLARDPAISFVAAQAARLPVLRPSAETVLAHAPDLVLAARYGAQTTLALLERSGVRVVRADLPDDFPGIRAETRRLAALLGVSARGEALLAEMDARLAAPPHRFLQDVGVPAPTALIWGARGYASGPGTLGDAVLRAAGYADIGRGGRLGLEALLAHRPDLLVVPDAPRFPSLATDLLDHPATAGIPRRAVPPALLICAGPFTARAVQMLVR